MDFDLIEASVLRSAIESGLQALDPELYAALKDIVLMRGSVVAVLTFEASAADPAASLSNGLSVQYAGSTITAEPSTQAQENKDGGTSAGLIAGAVVGGLVAVALLAMAAVVVMRNRKNKTAVDPFRSSTAAMVANPTYAPSSGASTASPC